MLKLTSIQEIIKALVWISSLGLSEVKGAKDDIKELISQLSSSLVNLWKVVKTVTAIDESEFTNKRFEDIYDYFVEYYVGDWNISQARTHCGDVERTAKRIKSKFVRVLHTDIGKWEEVEEQLKLIVNCDGEILQEYDASINKIDSSLREIKDLLKGNSSIGEQKYFSLKKEIEDDIKQLKKGVNVMEQAFNHINRIVG